MKKIIVCLLLLLVTGCSSNDEVKTETKKETKETTTQKATKDKSESFTISFAGDCTLGNYAGQPMSGSFNEEYVNQGKDTSYFLRNVKSVFEKDDLTVVNLEGPLTTATSHQTKQFPFSGLPEYANILVDGSVEAVSYANNHSEDYYQQGLDDTKATLEQHKIGYFGYDTSYTKEVKGIKLGFLGYRSMSMTMNTEEGKAKIKEAITNLKKKEKCDLVFVYYHWGIEREYYANGDQRQLAYATIDAGADAVIGSHPHVVQGTETYNGKPIVYSLSNFCFGGNRNPSDTDSMIYQLTYNFKGDKEESHSVNIIPVSITSSSSRNDYQPKILEGDEAIRVTEKIQKYSY